MKKSESEKAIRSLATKWFREAGRPEMPDYDTFRHWVQNQGYGHYLIFGSTIGAYEDAEQWFDEELKQTWRN